MNRPQDIPRYLHEGPCDCPVRVTEKDGQVHYVWLTGASCEEDPIAAGSQHGKGYREDWRLRSSRIKTIHRISEAKYRELSGWNGFL